MKLKILILTIKTTLKPKTKINNNNNNNKIIITYLKTITKRQQKDKIASSKKIYLMNNRF